MFQIFCTFQVRHEKCLPQYVDLSDPLCWSQDQIPDWSWPSVFSGNEKTHQNGVNTPGQWSTSSSQMTSVQYASNVNLREMTLEYQHVPTLGLDLGWDREDMLVAKSVLAGFGVLLPQAICFGATPFHDPAGG